MTTFQRDPRPGSSLLLEGDPAGSGNQRDGRHVKRKNDTGGKRMAKQDDLFRMCVWGGNEVVFLF